MARLVVGLPVDGRDGPLGTVAGTREAASADQQSYLFLRLSRVFGLAHTTRLVPVAWVRPAPADAQRVTLDASRAQVAGCPPLRADAVIQTDVAAALSDATGLLRAPSLRATVRDGVVDLTGHALNRSDTRRAVDMAWQVSGVLGVQDHAVEDGALAIAVAQALTHEPETRKACLRVASRLGAVTLAGNLPSAAAAQLATALALAVPGVTGVHNGATIASGAR